MPNKEYLVTKLSFQGEENKSLIQDVCLYEYDGELSSDECRERDWLVNRKNEGSRISAMTRNESGEWIRDGEFSYQNSLFSWGKGLPKNLPNRKTFVSYYHKDDQSYRNRFENLFSDLVVSKSVDNGDIDADHSDEYIKQLIQRDFLTDTTVLVVLIGNKTKCRKHVDWEISGALNYKVGDTYAGLLGLILPSHPDFGAEKATYDLMPARLADNFKSGYTVIRDWTENRMLLQSYIELAFNNRSEKENKRDNSREQMPENTCE